MSVMLIIVCTKSILSSFFFFIDTATTEIYTLSLHDALPIYHQQHLLQVAIVLGLKNVAPVIVVLGPHAARSEEHTSELQSRENLVCRLLLEKKNEPTITSTSYMSSSAFVEQLPSSTYHIYLC